MRLTQLRLENVRNLEQAELLPHEQLNYLYGDNGAGKTSVLESIALLSRGRSFRTGQIEEIIRREQASLLVSARLSDSDDKSHQVGIQRDQTQWRARCDGQDLSQLSQLTRMLPLVVFEPNSHQLVSGAPDGRRKFLDWGVFHVEHQFAETARRYARALKQRNAALRKGQSSLLDSIDEVMAPLGEQVGALRNQHVERLAAHLNGALDAIHASLGEVRLSYHAGWSGPGLMESLAVSRDRDLERGSTQYGPHRADLVINRNGAAVRNVLSRGEQKSLAAALLLTQAEHLSKHGEQPVLLLDDLASEFDQTRFGAVLDWSLRLGGQAWVTGTEAPGLSRPHKMFHVEHGKLHEVV